MRVSLSSLPLRWPIIPFLKDVTMQPFHGRKGKTKNYLSSVDAHLDHILTVNGISTIVRITNIVIIDRHYRVSMYNHLHPKLSGPSVCEPPLYT